MLMYFFLSDRQRWYRKKVVLNKARPQDFDKSEQIVVIGKMNANNFVASDVLMKCPSKYTNPKDDMKNISSSR